MFQSNNDPINIPGGSLDGFLVNQNPSEIIVKVRIHVVGSITIFVYLPIYEKWEN